MSNKSHIIDPITAGKIESKHKDNAKGHESEPSDGSKLIATPGVDHMADTFAARASVDGKREVLPDGGESHAKHRKANEEGVIF